MALSGRRKVIHVTGNSKPKALKVTLYTLDVKNYEGIRGNIHNIIESLPRTSYQDHGLSPLPAQFCCFQYETNSETEFGDAFLMTLKFWVAKEKI